jgi:hypothetical protein
MDATQRPNSPIYVSYTTFMTLLDWLRDMKVIPNQLDRTLWAPKFAGSTGVQLMSGLRFLGLLYDEAPTPRLEQLAMASNEDRKRLLAELVRDQYGADFVAGLSKATPRTVQDRMKELGATDATFRKAVSFFVNAAKAADIPMPTHIAKVARNRSAVRRGAASKTLRSEGQSGKTLTPPPYVPPGTGLETSLHPALVPLLKDLAENGPEWGQEEHDRWRTAFDTILDYSYPVQEDEGEEDGENEEGQ